MLCDIFDTSISIVSTNILIAVSKRSRYIRMPWYAKYRDDTSFDTTQLAIELLYCWQLLRSTWQQQKKHVTLKLVKFVKRIVSIISKWRCTTQTSRGSGKTLPPSRQAWEPPFHMNFRYRNTPYLRWYRYRGFNFRYRTTLIYSMCYCVICCRCTWYAGYIHCSAFSVTA